MLGNAQYQWIMIYLERMGEGEVISSFFPPISIFQWENICILSSGNYFFHKFKFSIIVKQDTSQQKMENKILKQRGSILIVRCATNYAPYLSHLSLCSPVQSAALLSALSLPATIPFALLSLLHATNTGCPAHLGHTGWPLLSEKIIVIVIVCFWLVSKQFHETYLIFYMNMENHLHSFAGKLHTALVTELKDLFFLNIDFALILIYIGSFD